MAVTFHPLPTELFNEQLQPHIKRFNTELRDLFGLEGSIRQPVNARRSDLSISRKGAFQVDVSRITPSISSVVSGISTVVGTPGLTFGTSNVIGGTTTALSVSSTIALFGTQIPAALASSAAVGTSAFAARADHVHLFPTTLRSTANAATLTLTDDATNTILTNSLGSLHMAMPAIVLPLPTVAASTRLNINLDPDFNSYGIQSAWSGGAISSATIGCWDAKFSAFGGVWASPTIVGYDQSTGTLLPTAGSSGTGTYYGIRMQPTIQNANLAWGDVASGYFKGVRRLISSPTITTQAGVIIEPPTAATSDQIGLLIRQQTAQATAANRIGIDILAQNSGTNRRSIRTADAVENTVTDIIASASAKGFIGQYSDSARYFRLRALYNGGAPSLTIDDVGTALPTT
jgi:hypothetical protein